MCADDVMIYCSANDKEVAEIRRILMLYCQQTGQEINWSKSSVHFSKNVRQSSRNQPCGLLGMHECNHVGKYLGQEFCNFKSKLQAFSHIFEKLTNKLAGWKIRSLSMAGQLTLIKSVAMALPSYTMQSFMLPKTLLYRMERKMRDFLWDFKDDGNRHLYLKSWSSICTPFHLGDWDCAVWRI